MKKPGAFLFLLLFTMPILGSYLYFAVRLNQIRYEMRSKLRSLPDDRLTKIVLTKEAYHRALVEEDELEIEGKMYDVARIEVQGDQVTIFGLHDEAEDNLISFLHEVLKNAARDNSEIPSGVYEFMTLSFLVPLTTWDPVGTLSLHKASTQYFNSESTYISVLDPPPPRT